ncbi:MFS transporter [Streptomyces endophyticus]|uniref:MFS transporter n=1 Tax=Streptomyces endophyticus TaxID=714166 RepID=A0ABU6F2T5_9ACTN|nr:MFS transporter [Streptomyces endophyticus]MEB8338318.1 MFS transporter [Streptomyces endophyticus]
MNLPYPSVRTTRSTSTTKAPDTAPPSPYRWVVLIACWLSFMLTSIDRSTWGPASVFVGDGLGVPLASLGVFATAYYVGYVISNALGGLGVDRFGPRIVLTVSLAGAGTFMTVFGSTPSAAVGIAVQGVVGLFAGADYSAGVRLISSWFPSASLGLPMGIFTTATSLGTAIANAVVPAMIAWHGWGTSYHVFGILSIVVAVPLFLLLRNAPGHASKADAPQETGVPKEKAVRCGRPDLGAMARNRDYLLVCVTGFFAFWGLYGFVTWANALMIRGHGVSPGTAGLVVSVFAISAVVAKPLVGFVTDRFCGGARKTPSIIILGVFALSLVWFGQLSTPTAFILLSPLLGAAAYGWTPLLVAFVPRLVPSSVTGTASGLANAVWQLGSVLVPLAVGAVFSATGSFNAAFVTLAAGPVLAMLAILPVRADRTRRSVTGGVS